MGHEDDENEETGVGPGLAAQDSEPEQRTTDVFTSAEYDLELLAKVTPTPSNESPTLGTDETAEHPSIESEKVAPWDIQPSSKTQAKAEGSNEPSSENLATGPELHELVERDDVQNGARLSRTDPPVAGERSLPGKGSQSVVVDMAQLNEEAEKARQDKAAQRAAFSPLESNVGMERITFSNLEALTFGEDGADDQDMSIDTTIDVHRDQMTATDSFSDDIDALEGAPKRPGRFLFLFLVFTFGGALLSFAWALYGLGEDRHLLTQDPIQALQIGWGLKSPPQKPVSKAVPVALETVSGSLKVNYVQVDWNKRNDTALVEGEVSNDSNVTYGRIELSVELFDEMTKSMVVRRTKCCRQERLADSGETPTTNTASNPAERTVLAPGKQIRFSTKLDVRKPKKGEVTAKVRVHYSEVMD